MKRVLPSKAATVVAGACFVLGCAFAVYAIADSQSAATAQKGTAAMEHASGPFEVKMTPQKPDNPAAEAADLGRMSFNKQYHGDLEATGKGEMLASGPPPSATGSGAYVALEKVTGTLKGRSGSFVLMHNGVMTRGRPQLVITVVPDSGTGQLAGISGKMNINIATDRKHSYDFEYTLAEK